jgi:hypothetical protein
VTDQRNTYYYNFNPCSPIACVKGTTPSSAVKFYKKIEIIPHRKKMLNIKDLSIK